MNDITRMKNANGENLVKRSINWVYAYPGPARLCVSKYVTNITPHKVSCFNHLFHICQEITLVVNQFKVISLLERIGLIEKFSGNVELRVIKWQKKWWVMSFWHLQVSFSFVSLRGRSRKTIIEAIFMSKKIRLPPILNWS